ncbi:MAG: insulinase family protein [Pseudomonadota bacterium]|nr:insulinase family protein [Pseudomonadota bacterium]
MLFLLSLPLAVAAPAAEPEFRPDFGSYRFDALDGCFGSGLRLVVVEDAREPTVSVTLVVDGGSVADPVGREGTAHVLEHLAFRTITPSGAPVSARLAALGAAANAETRPDATTFITVAPAARLASILAVEGQRLVDPLAGVTAADLESERAIVENELRRNELDRSGLVWDVLFAALYPAGHPYHTALGDTAASIGAVTLEDVRAYAARWYRPTQATLYVTGAVEASAVRDLALRVLPDPVAGVPAGSPRVACSSRLPSTPVEPPAPTTTEPIRIPAAVSTPQVTVGWALPGAWGEDDALAELAVQSLNLFLPGVACARVPGRLGSTATCTAPLPEGIEPSLLLKGLALGTEQLADARAYGEAVTRLGLQTYLDAEVSGHPFEDTRRAPALAAHMTGEPTHGGATLDALARLDHRAVVDFARRWLTAERAAVVVVYPANEAADLATTNLPHIPPAAPMDAPEAEPAAPAAPPDVSRVHWFDLPTGLRVVVLPYGSLPIVRVGLDFRGGQLNETTPGIAELLATMEVYEPRNVGFNVNRAADAIAAESMTRSNGVVWGYRDRVPAGNLDDILFLLRARLDGSELDWQRRGNFVERRARLLNALRTAPRWWANALASDRLFPGHPVARGWLDDERLLGARATTDAQVEAWRDRVRSPRNGTLYIVGAVDPVAAEAAVRARFTTWKGRGKAVAPLPALPAPPAPPARQVLLLDERDKALSTVVISCQVDGTGTPEALDVLESLATERVTDAWRVRTAWSYDPTVALARWEGGAAVLQIAGSLRHDVVGDALVAGVRLLGELATLPADHADVRRHARARTDVLARFTGGDTLEWLAEAWRAGWPESVAAGPARLAAVSGADIGRALAPCIGHEVIVAAGPVATLDDEAARLGAPVEVYEWRREAARRWKALDPDAWEKAQ